MAINNGRLSADHIMNQLNSLIRGEKTPAQVREEDGIIKPEASVAPTGGVIPSGLGTAASYYHPSVGETFSPTDIYRLKAEGYANQGNTAMADAYRAIADSMGGYSSFANNSIDSADALLNYLKNNEAGLQAVAGSLYNKLTDDIQTQRDYINNTFGPDGSLTREVNKYYDDLGNYLATDAGRQAANIAAQGIHSGASLGAIRAQQNEAYNQSFQRYVQAKEQEINAKQAIASNLINYMSTLRQEYGDTTDKYIIDLYKRANDMYASIAQSVANDITAYNKLRLQASSSNSSTKPELKKELVEKDGQRYIKYTYGDEVIGEAPYDANAELEKLSIDTTDDTKHLVK